MRDLSLGVQGKLTHELEDLREILQWCSLEWSLDEAAGEEVHSLHAVLTVTDVASLDVDHTDNGIENRGPEEGTGGQTNSNDGTARADVFGSLLEGLFGDGKKYNGMCT